jgi:hypothetical protein
MTKFGSGAGRISCRGKRCGISPPKTRSRALGEEALRVLTRAGISGPTGYLRAPRIDPAAVRLLWHVDFWDGPRSGMLLYRGEERWFELVAEGDEAGWYRRFVVLRLSPEQHAEERRWHDLFRQHVGLHTDYDPQGQRPVGALRPRAQWQGFYDAYRQRTSADFSGNEVLGWFEW